MKKCILQLMMFSLLFQFVIFPLSTRAAERPTVHPNSDDLSTINRRVNMSKILTVLENRVEDLQLLGKAEKKLSTLSDGQTRLIASLSDRVTEKGNTTSSDIAFLLMTVLITLL